MPDLSGLVWFAVFGMVVAALLALAALIGVGYLLFLGIAAL